MTRQDETGRVGCVAIIVRTKDRPELLPRALASVVAQRHRPLELVVVNDGSASVGGAVGETARDVPATVVQAVPPGGRSRAGQLGLETARSDWVCFLDDDDELLPDHVASLAAVVESSGARVAYADVEGVVETPGPDGEPTVTSRFLFADGCDPSTLKFENTIPFMAALIDRRLALEVGGLDPAFDCYEDWDLLLRLARRTPFARSRQVTARYHISPLQGHGTGLAGEHRAVHLARLFDKHRTELRGEDWARFFFGRVEPLRDHVRELEDRWRREQNAMLHATATIDSIVRSRSWKAIQLLRRLLGRR